jgi:hypothetical protein
MADTLGQTPPDECGSLGLGVFIGWLGESYGNDIAQIFVRLWRNRAPPHSLLASVRPLRQLKDRMTACEAV